MCYYHLLELIEKLVLMVESENHTSPTRPSMAPILAITLVLAFLLSGIGIIASADAKNTSSDLIESNVSQGNITLFSQNYSSSSSIPSNVFLGLATYPEIANATLVYDTGKKAMDFSFANNQIGELYIAGLTPMEKTTYHLEIGLQRSNWGSQSFVKFPGGLFIYQIDYSGNRLIRSEDGSLTLNLGPAADNRVAIDVILDTSLDTFRVKYSESKFIDIPWSQDRQEAPYDTFTGGFLTFETYFNSDDTKVDTYVYNVTQTAPRSYITTLGAKNLTAFGLDHGAPLIGVQYGAAAVMAVGGTGTIWADIGYDFMSNDTELAFYKNLVINQSWELGIHFSERLIDLSMSDATALMQSEYNQIEDRFGVAPTTWCCLNDAENMTHVIWAYNHLHILNRDFDFGVGAISNVGTLWTDTMNWWTNATAAGLVMPCFTHDTDLDPPGDYCLNLTNFHKWVDGYTASGIQITSFYDYYMTNLNAGAAQVTNVVANDQTATFTMTTNGARCYVNVDYHASAATVVSDQTGGSIAYTIQPDGSISFWTLSGHTYTIGSDYTYSVNNGKATITGYDGTGGVVTIPSTLGGYPVVAIGDYAFHDGFGVTSVTISDGVSSIGTGAFDHCTNLVSATIPNSVVSIGDYAFYCCSKLSSITIPGDVPTIGDYTFHACTALKSVTISDGVSSIGTGAFDRCSNLTSLVIPSSVKTIGDYAFFCCTNMTSVTIPSGVTSIGDAAFFQCSHLASVTIPEPCSIWEIMCSTRAPHWHRRTCRAAFKSIGGRGVRPLYPHVIGVDPGNHDQHGKLRVLLLYQPDRGDHSWRRRLHR